MEIHHANEGEGVFLVFVSLNKFHKSLSTSPKKRHAFLSFVEWPVAE